METLTTALEFFANSTPLQQVNIIAAVILATECIERIYGLLKRRKALSQTFLRNGSITLLSCNLILEAFIFGMLTYLCYFWGRYEDFNYDVFYISTGLYVVHRISCLARRVFYGKEDY